MMKPQYETLKGSNVLITGAAGFIGSWMAETLCDAGAVVVGVDNLATGSQSNLGSLKDKKNFSLLVADITRDGDVAKMRADYDYVLHLASRPCPDDYTRNQIETLLVNSVGTQKMLDLAKECGATFLYSSTSEIYGDSEVVPTPETYFGKVNSMGEMSSYKESKRFGEALCISYCRAYGLKVRIARIFNSYGPRIDPTSDYDRVISRFIKQALANHPITVHGEGKQSRSFCYVTDTVRGLIELLLADNANGRAVNIGSATETSILTLAEMVIRLANSDSEITFITTRPDDTFRRCPDITLARTLLNWEPEVSLEEGLRLTLDWFRG